MSDQPSIGVLRHLARSGGTKLTRCLGCMDKVVVLSEVHPAALRHTNPVWQAHEWFGLISPAERAAFERPGASFVEFVTLAEARARRKGKRLVLRDWAHIDYIGVPYASPTNRPTLIETLAPSFRVHAGVTVRHPLDQWLSLNTLDVIRGRLSPEAYLAGVRAFTEQIADGPFIRFEDFTRQPMIEARSLCDRLGVSFDPAFLTRWHAYEKVTGDRKEHASRGSGRKQIKPMERRAVEPALLESFRASEDYREICDRLGYEP
ncbi:MAG: hypothetical protein ACIARR_06355 [Phycisphaerales bacterium JB059]